MRAHARTHSRAFASVEQSDRADFAFCSRCFLCVLLPLFFSTPSASTLGLCTPFSSRLTRPETCISFSFSLFSLFLYLFCTTSPRRPARFLRPFSTGPCRYNLRCKSKQIPFFPSFFFRGATLPIDESRLKIGSLNLRLPHTHAFWRDS